MDLFPVCVCACAHVRVYNIIHVKLAKLYSKLNKVKVAEFVMTAQFLISNTYSYQLHAMHVQCALNELGLSACLFMCVYSNNYFCYW